MKTPEQINIEKKRNKNVSRSMKMRIAGAGFIGFSTSVFFGNAIINKHDQDEINNLRDGQVELNENQDQHEEAVKNLVRIKQNVGGGCLSSLSDYLPGGTLSSSDENTVVDDMLTEANLPCGTTRKEVRQIAKPLLNAYQSEIEASQNVDESEAQISPLQKAEEHSNAGEYTIAGLSTVAFTGVSIFFGVMWAETYKFSPKSRMK